MKQDIEEWRRHIDLSIIKELCILLSSEQFLQIRLQLQIDLDEYQIRLESISSDAMGSADVRRVFHRLCGFAKQFGFLRLIDFTTAVLNNDEIYNSTVADACIGEIEMLRKILLQVENVI